MAKRSWGDVEAAGPVPNGGDHAALAQHHSAVEWFGVRFLMMKHSETLGFEDFKSLQNNTKYSKGRLSS